MPAKGSTVSELPALQRRARGEAEPIKLRTTKVYCPKAGTNRRPALISTSVCQDDCPFYKGMTKAAQVRCDFPERPTGGAAHVRPPPYETHEKSKASAAPSSTPSAT